MFRFLAGARHPRTCACLSSLGVPGVPWHTQIFADQLTLFQPGGTDYAQLITTGTPGFSELPTALGPALYTQTGLHCISYVFSKYILLRPWVYVSSTLPHDYVEHTHTHGLHHSFTKIEAQFQELEESHCAQSDE